MWHKQAVLCFISKSGSLILEVLVGWKFNIGLQACVPWKANQFCSICLKGWWLEERKKCQDSLSSVEHVLITVCPFSPTFGEMLVNWNTVHSGQWEWNHIWGRIAEGAWEGGPTWVMQPRPPETLWFLSFLLSLVLQPSPQFYEQPNVSPRNFFSSRVCQSQFLLLEGEDLKWYTVVFFTNIWRDLLQKSFSHIKRAKLECESEIR